MDIFVLEAIVAELQQRLTGARINKVHQPGSDTVLLRLWTGRGEERLLLSAAPGEGRLHLTATSLPNPPHPLRFCQLLRARLSRLLAIRQLPQERIVELLFRGTQGEELRLLAEFAGPQSNLLLVDADGVIIDLLQRVAAPVGRRELLPGLPYQLPHPLPGISLADPLPLLAAEGGEPHSFRAWLLREVRPMSPLMARELATRVAAGAEAQQVLADFRRQWLARDFQPLIGELERKRVLSAFPLPALALAAVEEFASPSAAVESFYASTQSAAVGGRGEMVALLRRELKRLDKRLLRIEEES
ncbi:MAG: NFACT family protein, partial [Desulfuromonadales bacterium]|nr:NFACT family protein [Desulfuromonadales bacterium]